MKYRILLKRSAEKELERLDDSIHDRIAKAILSLSSNPRPPPIKKLQQQELYRLRIGEYRVLFVIDDRSKIVDIVSIAHRREAYRHY